MRNLWIVCLSAVFFWTIGSTAASEQEEDTEPAPTNFDLFSHARDFEAEIVQAFTNDLAHKLAGRWKGTYACGETTLSLVLSFSETDNGQLEGEYHFGPTDKSPDVPTGSYTIFGEYDANSGEITLNPLEWIRQPPNYVMVGLSGTIDATRSTMTGQIDYEACGEFRVRADAG
jgi:hypothetical protein